jgi:catechol 2,3-dioxygenase-like lactoylglutathione lyase family enzyme
MSAEPPPSRGLRHVALKCRDIQKMEGFYVGALGYRVEWRPDADNVYLTNGEDSLALHRDPSASERDSRLDHIGVLVQNAGDVDAWASHLMARGERLDATPRTHRDGCRSCYALDPEGNRIQFLWHPTLLKGVEGSRG